MSSPGVFSPTESERIALAEFRRSVESEVALHGIPGYFQPKDSICNSHWRDILARHRSKTQLRPTPDPRADPEYTAPSLRVDWWEDRRLILFLRAKGGDVKQATRFFLNALSWRRSFGLDDLMEQSSCPFMDLRDTIVPETTHHWTKDGARLYFAHYGNIRVDRLTNELMPDIALILEAHRMESQARETPYGEKLCAVFDAAGVTFYHRHLVPWLQLNELIDNTFFPEFYAQRLQHVYVINCPSFFPILINLLKPFLSARIREKFIFLGHNFQQTLRDCIGVEFLPKEYGGSCQQCMGVRCTRSGDEE